MCNSSILLLMFVVCVHLMPSQNQLVIVEDIEYLNHEREDDMPLITPFKNSLKLEVHENIALECDANEAIEWWYSYEGFKKSDDFIRIDDHQRPYGIRLHLENVSVVDVGAYYCIKSSQAPDPEADWSEQLLMELVNNDMASTIYIFVNDPNNLLTPVELELTAVQNSELVIPCKPSMPETEVVLKFKRKQFYSKTSSRYNPKQGFVIEISNVYEDSGKYYCLPKTPSPDNADEVTVTDVRYNNRQIDRTDYHNNKPIIKSNSSGYVYEGETFELICEMNVSYCNFYEIDWIYPDKTDQKRINITYSRIDELARITLVVQDSKFTDSGSYKCVLKANQLPKEYSSYNLSVMEPHTCYLQLANPSEQYTLNEHANKTILMTANFKGYPQPSFKWYKPNGIEIEETEQNLNIISTESSITLRMVNAQLKDSGSYILEGTNDCETITLVFNVSVISPPVLSMDDVYVMEGREAHLKCTVQSYPTAAVTFLFQPCSLKPRWPTCQTLFQNLSYKTNTTPGKLSVEFVHEAIFTPTEPGYILCVAQNLINNSQATTETKAHVILSDIPKNLTIVGLEGHLSLPIGYEDTFTCAALAYHFRGAMQWLYNGKPIVESNDITMNTTSTKYSYKKILKFNSITYEDQGTYTCRAWYINQPRRYESRDIYVYIYKPMAPQWSNQNLSHLKTNFVHHVGNVLDLECKTNAMPQAKVRWFKSEVELHKTNTTQISDDQTMLRIPHLYSKDKGVYKCEVENRFGTIERSFSVDITLPGISETWISMCIILIFFLVALCAFLIIRYRKEHKRHLALKAAGLANFEKGAMEHINPTLSWNEQAELLPYDRKFEFPRDKLKLGMQLGAGAFGVVVKGEAQGIQIDEPKSMVAVKMVNSTADIEEVRALVSELKIMVHLRKHLNVVNLLGAVTKNIAKRELMVIVEYCRFGNVQSFLLRNRKYFIDQINPINDRIDARMTTCDNSNLHRDHVNECGVSDDGGIKYADVGLPNHLYMNRMNFPNSGNIKADNTKAMTVTTTDLVSWAFQVARGMDYLSSKGVLHGDLAARNILLCDNNVVKICDFGLARTMYSVNYKKSVGGKLPIKWLALESLNDLVFSTYSDVWSFGIVLWELFSLSTAPYPGIDPSHELFNKLKDGYRMEKPPYANQELYEIMLECWRQSPDKRPLFNVLERRFANMLTEDVVNHFLRLNNPYMHANLENMKNIPTDYLLMTAPPDANDPIFPYMKIPEAPVGYLQMKRIAPQSCHPQVPVAAQSTV